MKVKSDYRSKFYNLSNWKEEPWKNQGFNGIRTRDLRDTGAMLYWAMKPHIGSEDRSTILPSSLLNSGVLIFINLSHIYSFPSSPSAIRLPRLPVPLNSRAYQCLWTFNWKVYS